MGNSHRKRCNVEHFMKNCRNFGVPPDQIVSRDLVTTDLLMKEGTRVGAITAYSQHIAQNTVCLLYTSRCV